jgi:hypothetical protein
VQRTFGFGLPDIGHCHYCFSHVLGAEKARAAKVISSYAETSCWMDWLENERFAKSCDVAANLKGKSGYPLPRPFILRGRVFPPFF